MRNKNKEFHPIVYAPSLIHLHRNAKPIIDAYGDETGFFGEKSHIFISRF